MKNISEQKLYVYLALFFGILFIFLTPPFQSPDEDSHFKKAYLVSKGILYPTSKNKNIGNDIPVEIIKYTNEKLTYGSNREQKYKYSEFVSDGYTKMNYNKKEFTSYSTKKVLFVAYIPAAFGIAFFNIITYLFNLKQGSFTDMVYFARLFSLLFSIFIVYKAIKTTPIFKKTIMVIALMPMSLFLMSMITYDSVVISVSLLTVAYILNLIFDKKNECIDKKNILILIFLGFILFNYKIIYSLLFILLLFIPKEKFGTLKDKIIKFTIICSSIIVLTLLFKIPLLLLPNVLDGTEKLINLQKKFVLNHIFTFLHIVFKNIIDQRDFQLTSMIGILGLIDTFIPFQITLFYLMILLFMGLTDNNDEIRITNIMKLSLIFIVCLSVFTIFAVMYISWTPQVIGKIGTYDLAGVQGRYFIPLLFPLLLVFSNRKIKGKYIDVLKNNYILGVVITLFISTITILLRFWV